MEKTDLKTVDQYIESFPQDIQENLITIRETIRKAVPEAEETFSYQMPAYKYHGWLVYFAAFKDHYSLFIPPSGVYEAFADELAPYNISKATLPFPKTEPIPFDLISRLVKYAAQQNEAHARKE
jgi:uncharacterized protein YdhG (YjbR/CyaY superfamily)